MSQIFELFGYPVDSWTNAAQKNLSKGLCPFMDAECDGGGNRFSSGIDLTKNKKLGKFFPKKKIVQSGVCSLQMHDGQQPWIVCPRRLLNYRCDPDNSLQTVVKERLRNLFCLNKGKHSVWSEVKIKTKNNEDGRESVFDYTFDYVIAESCCKPLSEVAVLLQCSVEQAKRILTENGFTIAFRNDILFCDDFPGGKPIIIEVMTSSTCGGNKAKGNTISRVFEDTVYKLNGEDSTPCGPMINYRQIWARMVSQLLVKSQIAMAWGGIAFWVLQDLLADYISKTTALNLKDFLASHSSEVNILSCGYGDKIDPAKREGELVGIDNIDLFAGPVTTATDSGKSFVDIVKLGCSPKVDELWKILASKPPCATFSF